MSKEEAAVWSRCAGICLTYGHAGVPQQKSPSLQDVMHLRGAAVSTVSQQEFGPIPDHNSIRMSYKTQYFTGMKEFICLIGYITLYIYYSNPLVAQVRKEKRSKTQM